MPKVPSSVIVAARATLNANEAIGEDITDETLRLLADQLYGAGLREAQSTMMQSMLAGENRMLDIDTLIISATAEEVLARAMTKIIWNMNDKLSIQQLAQLIRLLVDVSNDYGVNRERG